MSGYLPPHGTGGSASELYIPKYQLKKSDPTGDGEEEEYHLKLPNGVIPSTKTLICVGGESQNIKFQPLGFGLWGWGDVLTYGFGPSGGYDHKLTDDSIHGAWKEIFKSCNRVLMDTAEHYGYTDGYSEKKVGQFLTDAASTHDMDRSQMVFATKYFPTPWRHPWRYPNIVLNSLSGSLNRSSVGKVDIYQLHGPSHWGFWPRLDTLCDSLAKAYETGNVNAIGTCNLSFEQVKYVYTYMKKVRAFRKRIEAALTSKARYSVCLEPGGVFSCQNGSLVDRVDREVS
jgi:aryl-alcohol dehydrogenase-like predicted oxidoreductase